MPRLRPGLQFGVCPRLCCILCLVRLLEIIHLRRLLCILHPLDLFPQFVRLLRILYSERRGVSSIASCYRPDLHWAVNMDLMGVSVTIFK